MKENSSQNNRGPRNHSRGGRRSGNSRGPRRENDRNDQNGRAPRERSNYGTRETQPAKPLSFWQKIVALFTGKSPAKKAPVASAPSRHPTELAAEARAARPSDSYRRVEQRPDRQTSESSPETGENRDRREARPPREPREPLIMEKIEVTSPKLYVGNLSFDATESDLSDLFNGVGKVKSAEVVSNNYTQKSKGFAFVTMESIDEAKRAVVELHDKEFMGRKLLVSGAKTSERDAA